MKRFFASFFGFAALAAVATFGLAFTAVATPQPAQAQCWGAGCDGGGSRYMGSGNYSLPRETIYNAGLSGNQPTLCWRATSNCYTFGHADTYGKSYLCNIRGHVGNVAAFIRNNGGGNGNLVAWFEDCAPGGAADGRWLGRLCVENTFTGGGVCGYATEVNRRGY